MRFWDSSAIVPLVIDEPSTKEMQRTYDVDPDVAAWWATELECVSALARRERRGELSSMSMEGSLARLADVRSRWTEIEPSESVRRTTLRLLRVHDFRAADGLQLAAAISASEATPEALDFVTLDDRLRLAAEREGFPVLP